VQAPHWNNFHPHPYPFHSFEEESPLPKEFCGTVLEGAYMTDFYKGLPSPDETKLKQWFAQAGGRGGKARLDRVMVDLLQEEARIMGITRPVWVAVGTTAQKALLRHFPGDDVVFMYHWSGAAGKYQAAARNPWGRRLVEAIGEVDKALRLERKHNK